MPDRRHYLEIPPVAFEIYGRLRIFGVTGLRLEFRPIGDV